MTLHGKQDKYRTKYHHKHCREASVMSVRIKMVKWAKDKPYKPNFVLKTRTP